MARQQRVLRFLLLFGVPVLTGTLSLFHPTPPSGALVASLQPVALWWTALHLVQLPLFALLGVAVLVAAGPVRGVARIALWSGVWTFTVFYSAYDAIPGIATGVALMNATATGIDAVGAEVLTRVIAPYFNGPVALAVAAVGIVGWWTAGAVLVRTLAKRVAPRPALLLLGIGMLSFGVAHVPPFGPLGMLTMTSAFAWIERNRTRAVHAAGVAVVPSH